MKLTSPKKAALFVCVLVLFPLLLETSAVPASPPPLPVPVAVFMGPEFFEANGKQWTRYRYDVVNRTDFPNTLFAPAPKLPPCGLNRNASRTWVDIFDLSGKRLNGFCALGSQDDLSKLWFALERDVIPPSWIRIVITDRETGEKTQSALVDTVE
jgi:hypothetical protein